MQRNLFLFFACLITVLVFILGCKKSNDDTNMDDIPVNDTMTTVIDTSSMDSIPTLPQGAILLDPNPQPEGDPAKGYDYLVNGNYLSSGIPIDIFTTVFDPVSANVLNRTGDNATLSPEYTAINHANGVRVVTANCLECHGSYLNGEYIVGLGNINADFTEDRGAVSGGVRLLINENYGPDSPESDAFAFLEKASLATGPHIKTEVVGLNPADHLFAILAAHREPTTLEWSDQTGISFPDKVVATDVPPWWLLKKKNAPLYNGMGRGNFANLFMAASTLTLESLEEAEEIATHFNDVMAFIRSIEAPKYPYAIDESLAAEGKVVFEKTCSTCHGTYGENESYPNLLFPPSIVGTDDAAVNGGEGFDQFINWFNNSYFATGNDAPGTLEETGGYVAQPLDGIWASAPYIHNGSVPTLYEMLKSDARKDYWRRDKSSVYDQVNVGWTYSEESSKIDKHTYDNSLYGYGNGGHTFGDHLTDENRMAVIEYLKTL